MEGILMASDGRKVSATLRYYGAEDDKIKIYYSPSETPEEIKGIISNENYTFDTNTGTIIKYTGDSDYVQIPFEILDIPVTRIGSSAFEGNTNLWAIDIPESITYIGNRAFADCQYLKYISFSDNITEIGDEAFCGNITIETISLPSNLTKIGNSAFNNCTSINEIIIPDSVTEIGVSAFRNCSSAVELKLSVSLTEISEYAFLGCSKLQELKLPDSVKTINAHAFDYCANAYRLIFGKNSSLETIKEFAFSNCVNISDFDFPSNVRYIGQYAFASIKGVREIHIPPSVRTVSNYAFKNCINLNDIYITNQTYLQKSVFENCGKQVKIYSVFDSAAEEYAETNGMAFVCISYPTIIIEPFSEDFTCGEVKVIARGVQCTLEEDYHIFTDNGSYTFYATDNYGNRIYKSVSVNSILKDIIFDKTKGSIVKYTGYKSRLIIPEQIDGVAVQEIGSNAFERNSLSSVVIPDSVKKVGDYAFYGCAYLKEIRIPSSVETIGKHAFDFCVSVENLYFATPSVLKEIDDFTFSNLYSLKSVNLPDSLLRIGNYSFSSNKSLTDIEIPETVDFIGKAAFKNCASLTSGYIFSNVESMGDIVFADCPNITLFVPEGSFAETYAKENKLSFSLETPKIIIKDYNLIPTAENVTVEAYGIDCILTETAHTFTDNGSYVFTATDNNGNIFSKTVTVTNIDRQSPVITITGVPNGIVSKNVIINAETNEGYLNKSSYTFSENGSFTFTAIDAAGNTASKTVEITAIDKRFIYDKSNNSIIKYLGTDVSVRIPEKIDGVNISKIGYKAFANSEHLEEIIIPSTITEIDEYAFSDCINLIKVVLPDNFAVLGDCAFLGCSALKTINLPDNLTLLGNYAFSGCSTLESIKIPVNTELGVYVFYNCASLESVRLPDNLNTIPRGFFSGCSSLKNITIPDGVENIGGGSFYDCKSLENIIIPRSVRHIYDYAFCGAYLTSVTIPEKTVYVGYKAFYCEGLQKAVALGTTTTLEDNTFKCDNIVLYNWVTLKHFVDSKNYKNLTLYNNSPLTLNSDFIIPAECTVNIIGYDNSVYVNTEIYGTLNLDGYSLYRNVSVERGGKLIAKNVTFELLEIYGGAELTSIKIDSNMIIDSDSKVDISELQYDENYSVIITGDQKCTVNIHDTDYSVYYLTIDIGYTGEGDINIYDNTFYSERTITSGINITGKGNINVYNNHFITDNVSDAQSPVYIESAAGQSVDLYGNTFENKNYQYTDRWPNYESYPLCGVYLYGSFNGIVKVRENKFLSGGSGVYSRLYQGGSGSLEINGNTFENIETDDVYMNGSSDTRMTGNVTIKNNTGRSYFFNEFGGGNIEISGNVLKGENAGMLLLFNSDKNITISDNEIERENQGNGIIFNNSRTTRQINISGNKMSCSENMSGILLSELNGGVCEITDNSINCPEGDNYAVSVNLETCRSFKLIDRNNIINGRPFSFRIFGKLYTDFSYEGRLIIDGLNQNGKALTVTGELVQDYDIDLSGGTLTVNGNYQHNNGELKINGGSVQVSGAYRSEENAYITMNGVSDYKNISVNGGFYPALWSSIHYPGISFNGYIGVSQKLKNGPGTNYWNDSQADTLANRFVKAMWKEGSWCYIEYPVISGNSITGYKRGYASVPGISTSAGAKSYSSFTAYSNYIDVFYMPDLKRRIGNAAAGYEVTVIGEENGSYYIEYWSTENKVYKRGYTPKAGILNEKTVVSFGEDDKVRSLYVGDTFILKPIFYPSGTKNTKLEWTSSDTSVATVDQNGNVTAKGAGTATITAKLTMNGEKATCTVTVNYCGGNAYKDVTKHKLVLQDDGYYICSKCKYRIKSPALQDKEILSEDDYYKVLGCYLVLPYYAKKEESHEKSERLHTNKLLEEIDNIRSKINYLYRYEYSDSQGKYKREYTTENQNDWYYMPTSVEKIDITKTNINFHNGVVSGFIKLFIGFYAKGETATIIAAMLSNNNYDSIGAIFNDLLSTAGYSSIAQIIDLINFSNSIDTGIVVGDIVVEINFTAGAYVYVSKVVFTNDGKYKAQYHY